jgi:HK97 gp10 family phage protein
MSVSVEINVAGAEDLRQALSRLDKEMQAQVQRQLADWAAKVKTHAQQLAPVRSGNLRDSIFVKTQNWNAQVGAEVPYAAAIEFGTLRTQARPFLQPALKEHLPQLEQVLVAALNAAKTEAGL